MQYIEIEDGKIAGHYSAAKMPKGDQFKEVTNYQGYKGLRADALNEDGSLKTQEELIEIGVIQDNRGTYWHTKTKQRIAIKDVNVELPEGFTDKEPGQFDEWNGSEWVENTEAKAEYEKAVEIAKNQQYLNSTNYMITNCMEHGVSMEEWYPGVSQKRTEAWEKIKELS